MDGRTVAEVQNTRKGSGDGHVVRRVDVDGRAHLQGHDTWALDALAAAIRAAAAAAAAAACVAAAATAAAAAAAAAGIRRRLCGTGDVSSRGGAAGSRPEHARQEHERAGHPEK
ncbi:hypothetical protein E8A74_44055 [Polyangium fumosum]|uniref:Uncharacterized protein n=1 Tax=Polyangium fumosum TaxID=889272 RepID=A0A4U1IS90_9BACT|nr:hypothetical protein E8A74_44055 [Polyangium fumosum]